MASSSSSSSSFFDIEPLDDGGKARRIAMDACSLCQKPLGGNCDIFMYRGDTPFCSVECRYYQMEKDEISVKPTKHGKKHSAREEQKNRHGTSASESRNVSFVANVTVAS